ncbi:MAG: cysteine--tRNA ligase [Candidatus Omnitrophica bacterium]|nr:cysteine--tRNA ligase [Candidatus Omnitrophota bacterium]
MLKIYNTLTRKKEQFIPQEKDKIKMYTCGVTVYDDCHIGHARSLYIFDVIRKYLTYKGYEVTFVRNITDIDDKIINRANELKVDWKDLVEKYIAKYYEDLKALGIDKADSEPRATENIPDMIKYITSLIEKSSAYESGGDVYFDVRKFPKYGQLSGQNIEQMETGTRVDPSELKKDALDFALWKRAKEGEPFWDSPWGKGRPGWHIECSVMSQKYLKTDTLDIHAGGRDLVFPHHENEIAQAEALTGKTFSKFWIHHGLLTINGQKMSKSLGNFVTIRDFMDTYKDPDILKLFFLAAHYSQSIDYSDKKIEETKRSLERINNFLFRTHEPEFHNKAASKPVEVIEGMRNRFIETMDDDFNTAEALAVIFDLVKMANKRMDDFSFIYEAKQLLKELSSIFSLGLDTLNMQIYNDEEIKRMIEAREKARKEKNYKLADDIRKELEKKGIILEDGKNVTIWRKKI